MCRPTAPDHAIVVTGVGQADLQSIGSTHAAAQKIALDIALADAKARADAIASDTGLTISAVLSVGASVSTGYGVTRGRRSAHVRVSIRSV